HGVAGHRGRGVGVGADRVRRHHRPAPGPVAGGFVLPGDPAAGDAVRWGVPGPGGPCRAYRGRAARGADRGGHGPPRGPVLRGGPACQPAGGGMTAVEVTGLRVALDRVPILHGIDLRAEPGEWVTVIGPNGAGKSTLLRAVGGVLPATGTVRLFGNDLARMPRRQRARLV